MKKRRGDLQQHVDRFVRLYRRKKVRGLDPNDRLYDRNVEQLIKRMNPAELDRLLHGGESTTRDGERAMGLSIVVGILSDVAKSDPEAAVHFRADFARLNEVLAEKKLPPHREPECLPPLANRCRLHGFPYSFIHTVRRAYAHRVRDPNWVATPLAKGENAARDRVVEDVSMDLFSHLLCHSDAEGYYLPVDFRDILFDHRKNRIPGGMLGSSHRLFEELVKAAPALAIQLDGNDLPDREAERINAAMDADAPLSVEQITWLSLYEAARLSLQHKAAICFT